ncbi:MAG: transporter [Hyphomonadaceae bacterium]|nr:transporter [Hyphomonadaceae bacterium]
MRTTLLAVLAALPASALAQDFVPGRPGATESPIAVPQGRWQVETEVASFARDDDTDTTTSAAFETTFRYGFGSGWDGELIASPYNRIEAGGSDESGAGDITLRLRKTFAGLDGEALSFGLIGYVTLPTGENDFSAEDVEGGVSAAGGAALGQAWELTWTAGVGAVSFGDGAYDTALSGGVAFSRSLNDHTGFYLEAFADQVDGDTAATGNLGVTHLWEDNTQLDANIDFGLTDAAPDLRVSIGWARLF